MILIFSAILIFVKFCHAGIPGTSGDLNEPVIQKQLMDDAKVYLYKYGYITGISKTSNGKEKEPTDAQVQDALKRFQSAFLYYSSGKVDVPTQAKMDEWRCALSDMANGQPIPAIKPTEILKKKLLTWKLTEVPTKLKSSTSTLKTVIQQAFNKWGDLANLKFKETSGTSDITVLFSQAPKTSFKIAAASSTDSKGSIIFLDADQEWSLNSQSPYDLSLHHTILHEIGHILGLSHNFYRGSIMHPIFKPIVISSSTIDAIPIVDRLAIRKLLGNQLMFVLKFLLLFSIISLQIILVFTFETDNNTIEEDESGFGSGEAPQPTLDTFQSKCPKLLDSVFAINDQEWFLFRENKVYRLNNRRFADEGNLISSVFPRGPQFVNATVTSGNLILLFVDRTIYGYEYDGVQFQEARGYPKELHDRVLFYPQGAFPMNNGSVVLLSGNVFATYNVAQNAPSFLNDKNRYFPNLPEDFRAGIEKTQEFTDAYFMFDEATVTDYDMNAKQVLQITNIPGFLKCL
ncbi:unnamed protein product [Caenorhabditis angaria]|uniref:Peptidase metallopeptidase domain-containing protein n=1 Tax=Caenorhabditis angaria TaxID=860376 RepID=A0A9P1N8J9_9PELO|nr:unnamed protein product [Caenorhabditis angaria]